MKRIFQVLVGIMLSCSALAQFQGNALQFDGANDNVSATLPALFNDLSTTDFTMEAWVYPQGVVFSRIIYAQASATNFATMSTGGTNNIYFYVVENGTTYSIATSANLPSNTWTHVTARWTTASNSVEVFYNGVLQTGIAGGTSSTGSLNNLSIGTRPGGAQYFPGTLDEVRIWSEARSNCEIQANYTRSMTGTETNLVVNYDFNQGVAGANNAGVITLPDLVAGNNGTLNSFTLNGATSNWITSTATINASGGVSEPSTTITMSECDSYFWPQTSQFYMTSGQYSDTLTAVSGCDSIVVLDLTVLNTTSSSLTVSACESYHWTENGATYTTSGSYYDTIPNAAGCDSIITLNLTINLPTTSSVTASACSSFIWLENGMTYTTSGSYNDTISNVSGCDSIITLNLTINLPSSSSSTITECDSYTWNTNGMIYTASGTYIDTLSTVSGCDSIVTLNLTIVPTPTANATFDGLGTLTGTGGSTFQWINCTTNAAIAGAASATYAPPVNGTYAVVVSDGSCSDTSDCVVVNVIGLNENQPINASIYPNPTTGEVTITFDGSSAGLIIRDTQGKSVRVQIIQNGEAISLESMQTGVYFFELTTDQGKTTQRLVKQ